MFTSHDIVAELRAKPFAPFQIALSDGRAYDVVHPDQAMVTRGHVVLGIPPDAAENSGVFEDTVKLAILHVIEIRPLRRQRSRKQK
ncbi:MAG: hypothetical protein FLDDKLPJ_01276 [Phycisphaerae bacterium]|nr:hypothetical protein [Phycisphaerae bacterium]